MKFRHGKPFENSSLNTSILKMTLYAFKAGSSVVAMHFENFPFIIVFAKSESDPSPYMTQVEGATIYFLVYIGIVLTAETDRY